MFGLSDLAALKARREGELKAAERALGTKPDPEQAQELVEPLPQVDVDVALLADESFREMRSRLWTCGQPSSRLEMS